MNRSQPNKGAVMGSEVANFFDQESGVKKHPVFDAMVKNFSQYAYINTTGKGLELYP